ncbi:DUF1697 domain-containing protein [Soonwooa sp.]|uniref:DUF1697 domain-containing protein n=1 Tax=Soonwooa sp. TaxID=1938592 RepID=UPI0028AB86DE|nr:DUF1697 domain-containing protein [Soonwooa sp.]
MKFCAFLRGVNVNGTSMKMKDVCDVFSKGGMQNVQSLLASGNILFESENDAEALKPILEKSMSEAFSYEAFLFVRSLEEIEAIAENMPFKTKEDFHNYVFISDKETSAELLTFFENAKNKEQESAKIVKDVFYWQTPKGNTLQSDFGKILGKKSLKDKLTSRNFNTIEKIIAKQK